MEAIFLLDFTMISYFSKLIQVKTTNILNKINLYFKSNSST